MQKFTNVSESSVSMTEMRLAAATKIAELKMQIAKYQQLSESASESSVSLTEMRLTAAIKIAALKIDAEKHQQLERLAAEPDEIVAAEKVFPVPTPTQSNECQKSSIKKAVQEPSKTKMSETDWVNKQAKKLLSNPAMKKYLRQNNS